MRRQRIDFVCGQESGLPAGEEFYMRLDSGEMVINCGPTMGANGGGNSRRSKARNCFILNKEMGDAFVKGGRVLKRHGPRLSTIEIPWNKERILLINSHFPDSDRRKKRERETYMLKTGSV